MAKLEWDNVGERYYQLGVSHGVVYADDGRYAVWNGLVSVSESTSFEGNPVYYDGRKISNQKSHSDFSGTITAYTYPEIIQEFQGLSAVSSGVYLGEQSPQMFNMTYQTKVGSDVEENAGYRIHILYNVTATPTDISYATVGEELEPSVFSWELSTVPEEVDGFRPTSHVILDSRLTNPELFATVELMLYGGEISNPVFPAFDDLMELLLGYYIIEIIDNKDGTWTAVARGDYIDLEDTREFTITGIDATYLDPDTYEASSTFP